ncbi:MAG: hypothetical protein R3D84_04605 [Paracoccaceae bacterium]
MARATGCACAPRRRRHGDPFTRDPALVGEDVRLGRYAPDDALRLFGVVADAAGEVDAAATAAARAAR